jgi:riboflavin kinase/FMN adenylyltransferase
MIVARSIDELAGAVDASCVTIGNFDGVHMGHQRLIRTVVDRALSRDLLSVVVTFDPHPLRVLKGGRTPPFITLTDQKLQLISGLGPEVTLLLPFTPEFAALEPEEFVGRLLFHGLGMRSLIIGHDYAFGRKRKGNFELLRELGGRMGFEVDRIEPVVILGAVVSSTRIRDMVEAGHVWDVRPLLGRFYRVQGRVIAGRGRGAEILGIPTANLRLVDELVPRPGVYAVWAEPLGTGDDRVLPGVANIGYNPTFGNDEVSVEVHILDFSGDLYDRELGVHFVQRVRSERKFSGPEELKERILADISLGRRILESPESRIGA